MDMIQWIDEKAEIFTDISDQIWSFAELGYHETQSAKLLADTLEDTGFTVERGVADIPTAFIGSYGSEGPVIAILGEFDALPGLSQQTVTEQKPVEEGGNGHGCGHNLLGTGALAAAMAVKEKIAAGELRGTVRYYGCPAEENGSGKAFMVRAGLFDDVDLALTWHPGMFNGSFSFNLLSNVKVRFKFYGRAAHAAADPQNGRSALDAVELMNVGVNYLREHIIPDGRIHYVITNGGGVAPNVVPAYAESLYIVRAPRPDQLKPIYERVLDIARGAALMTETTMEAVIIAGCSNLIYNGTIVDVFMEKMKAVPPLKFSGEERQFAKELTATFPAGPGMLGMMSKLMGGDAMAMGKAMKESILFEGVVPAIKTEATLPGSSDVGDVSWVTPTGQIMTTCHAFGTPGHSWQEVAQNGMSIGHKGMIYAGKVIAETAAAFLADEALLKKARDEFEERIKETPFVPLIPEGTRPPL